MKPPGRETLPGLQGATHQDALGMMTERPL